MPAPSTTDATLRKSIEPPPGRALVLFPGALGDLLCCWPALAGLRTVSDGLTVVAGATAASVLPAGQFECLSIDRREVADLFGDAPLSAATRALFAGYARVDSFTGAGTAGVAARLAAAAGQAPRMHAFRGMRDGEHATDYYARCLGVLVGSRHLPIAAAEEDWAAAWWRNNRLNERTLVMHAGSRSAQKNWAGMSRLAAAWRADGGSVVGLSGPAEGEPPRDAPHDAMLRNAPLPRVAAVLARGDRYVGNDSGISHLAGLVGARGAVVFGDSDARTWRPHGALQIVQAAAPCGRCAAALCLHRVSVDDVLRALARA